MLGLTNARIVGLVLLLATGADAQCKATGKYTMTGVCSATALEAALGTGCLAELGKTADAVCKSLALPFSEISQGGYHHDKNYFDGGTAWNNNEGKALLQIEMGQVMRFEDHNAANTQVGWPAYSIPQTDANGKGRPEPSNFDSCAANTVMCCYVNDRFDGVLENAALDGDVCHHSIESAKESNHVRRGFTIVKGEERNTNCFGFTWETGTASDRFKGNMLYDISMRKTLKEGYVKNVPGAPMCACIEQMPVVTKAACASIGVTNEGGTLNLNKETKTVTGYVTATLAYGNCGGKQLKEASSKDLSKYIVPSCNDSTDAFMNELYYVPDTRSESPYMKVNKSKWEQFAGWGIFFYPYGRTLAEGDTALRAALAKSPNPIIYRYCPHCTATHQHLYYRRKTPIPTNVNFLEQLLNKFNNVNNTLFTDFLLYDSYDLAVAGKNETSFQFCLNDPNADVGFPHDCGKEWRIWNNWNRYTANTWMPSESYHHSFWVEKPATA
jgi:hypothetical protein